ncbi:hypothetical protein Cgig2_031330 [Carnegiea gigantea]|uniref:t-SNARE coiled-coil homology domain-containing protein n=1 Tax=Carnegiea gigantea TaxID=171969 RepID=A0A9Q1KMV2_9CARY|nr:hypothetical protein Cgig2_031330 [Carnegiea gigantea]
MFGFMKKNAASSNTSPAHPDAESGGTTARRTSSEPILVTPDMENESGTKYTGPTRAEKKKYENGFRDSGGLENQSVQELEKYAAYKAEETTSAVNNCLKIAEDIREDASKTLETLHAQGEQIHRTHQMAANMDHDLSRGEKLLNSLGGMFSKPWKPKKTRNITGPLTAPDQPAKPASKEQKEKLTGKGKTSDKTPPPEPANAMQKVELEKKKQDDALDDLSNILGDLKGMAVDMGSELERQNNALDHLGDDIDELNSRVKQANQRTRKLLS